MEIGCRIAIHRIGLHLKESTRGAETVVGMHDAFLIVQQRKNSAQV
jgi:hypothetical protein